MYGREVGGVTSEDGCLVFGTIGDVDGKAFAVEHFCHGELYAECFALVIIGGIGLGSDNASLLIVVEGICREERTGLALIVVSFLARAVHVEDGVALGVEGYHGSVGVLAVGIVEGGEVSQLYCVAIGVVSVTVEILGLVTSRESCHHESQRCNLIENFYPS